MISITFDLPPDLAAAFAAIAAAEGRTPEEYLRDLVEREIQRRQPGESNA
jgi:hypothetical protein